MSAWLPCFACIIWSISILHPSILKEMEVKKRESGTKRKRSIFIFCLFLLFCGV